MITRKHIGQSTATARPTGPARISFPFWSKGDRRTVLIEQDYHQDWATLSSPVVGAPLNIASINVNGYQLPQEATRSILLEETQPQPIGGGLAQFTRIFGVVPQPREEPAQLVARYPGRASSTATTAVYSAYGTTPGASTVSAGDVGAFLFGVYGYTYYAFGSPVKSGIATWLGRTAEMASASPFSVRNDNRAVPTGSSLVFGVVANAVFTDIRFLGWRALGIPGRSPRTVTTYGKRKIQYAYGLDAATTLAKAAVPLVVTNAAGEEVDTLSATTIPTLSAWKQSVTAGEFFIPEPASINEWLGPIYSVETLYAPYD